MCQALHREPVAPHLITQEAAWYVQGSNCRQYRGHEQVPCDKVGAEAVDVSRGHINGGLNGQGKEVRCFLRELVVMG